jgi:hypothetical protein
MPGNDLTPVRAWRGYVGDQCAGVVFIVPVLSALGAAIGIAVLMLWHLSE